MPETRIVIDETVPFPIAPANINAKQHLYDAFANMETEIAAGYIVRMCQDKGGWFAFTDDEIETFYRRAGYINFDFNRLVNPDRAFSILTGYYDTGGGWVIRSEDGKYRVTDEFIWNCYKSSPAQELATV